MGLVILGPVKKKNPSFLDQVLASVFWPGINSAKKILQANSINFQNVKNVLDVKYQDDRSKPTKLNDANSCVCQKKWGA